MIPPSLVNLAAIKWMSSSGVEIKMHPSPQFSNSGVIQWVVRAKLLLLRSADTCLQALSQDMKKAICIGC